MDSTVILVIVLVTLGLASYIYLMIYHPEWVGITGKSAKKTINEHQEGSIAEDLEPFSSKSKK